MRVKHRTLLRSKEQRILLEQLKKTPGLLHIELKPTAKSKARVERIVLDDRTELFFVDNQPWLIQGPELLFPA
ncbi:MAG: hypothetical protein ACFFDP_09495, partial [Promethearchaeota archaeon]